MDAKIDIDVARAIGAVTRAVEDRTVTSADRLTVALERHGGYVAELTPANAH